MRFRSSATDRYDRAEAMGRESISRLLLRFSGPAIIASETAAFYNLFDAIWCGRLGPEALAALSVANPLMAIYRAIAGGIGVGAASLISRSLGAGKREDANRAAGCCISLFFLVSGLLTIVCLMNLEFLLRLFGAGDSVVPLAYSYMYVETVSMALDFFLVILVELIRAGGNPGLASSGTIISSIVDLIWSPILVFGVGPIPSLGIAGAALGTTIGRGVGVAILSMYIGLGKSIYNLGLKDFKLVPKIVVEVYRIGVSQTLRASAASLSQIVANRAAASFGVVPLAVLGVLFKVNHLVFGVCMGIGQGMLPLVGYNFGAKKKERVGEVVLKAGLTSFIWGAVSWVFVSLFSAQIVSLFGTDPSFLSEGAFALRILALGFFTVGVQNNLSFFFQGIGKALPSLVVASCRQLLFLTPCLLAMPKIFGLTGLWAAYPVADALSLLLTLSWAVRTFRNLQIPLHIFSVSQQASTEPKGSA